MQKFLIILAAFLLPFFVSAQPVVTSATRVKLFKGDSIFTAPLSGLASAIGGGNRPDSAFAIGAYATPGYWGKTVNSNLWKKGTLSLRTADTTGMLTLHQQDSANLKPSLYFSGDGEYIWKVKRDSRGGASLTDLNFTRKYGPSGDGNNDNQIFALGFNVTPGGGREITGQPSVSYRIEENFRNGAGNVNAYECHLPDIRYTDGSFRRPLTGYFSRSTTNRKGYWGWESDIMFINDFQSQTQKAIWGIGVNTGYTKGITFLDTASFTMQINNTGGFWQRNAAGSAGIRMLMVDNTDRILLGGSGPASRIAVYDELEITNGGFLTSYGTRQLYIGKNTSTAGTRVEFRGWNEDHIRFSNNIASNYFNIRCDANGGQNLMSFWNSSGNLYFRANSDAVTNALTLVGSKVGLNAYAGSYSYNATVGGTMKIGTGADTDASPMIEIQSNAWTSHIYSTNQTPEARSAANVGSIALTNDGGAGQLYVKLTGTGNTGWGKLLNLKDANGASSGQVLKWNGSAWAPGTDNTSGGLPSGTSPQTLRYDATNTLVATSQITNDGATVGIGTAPNASYELDVAGKTRAQGLRAEGTTMQPSLELANTTPTTGKTFTMGSSNTGVFYISSDVAGDLINGDHATGEVTVNGRLTVNSFGSTATSLWGGNATNELTPVTVGSGLSLTSGTLIATGGSVNVIRPTNITSDQDNYAPTGWSTANKVLITGDATGRAITSFSASGISDGHTKTIINNGDNYIYFPAEHPDGTASNRIDYTRDFILTPKSAVDIMYDATDARWMITSPNYNTDREKQLTYTVQPGSVTAGDWGHVAFGTVNVGSLNQAQPVAGVPGTIRLSTSTSVTGGGWMGFAKAQTLVTRYGDAHLDLSADVSIPTLSDASNRFYAALHFGTDQTTATFPNVHQVGIRYKDNQNGGRWEGYTRAGISSETTVDLGVTVAANTLYSLRIVVDEARTEARFYIDNVYRGRIAAAGNEFPSAATTITTRALCFKELGTTARSMDVAKMTLTLTY